MINLDDGTIYARLDPENMRQRIRELPRECLKGWQQAGKFKLPSTYSKVDKVVILGMGGSAIGADLLASVESKIPILVYRDYDLPPFVDSKTLVIASSYSGNTEETLSAFAQALGKSCLKLAITTGGKLREVAQQNKLPVYTIEYKAPPRAALAHSFIPLLGICCKLGLVADKSADITETAKVLEELQVTLAEDSPQARNPAKQLAARLHRNLPVIYGAGFLSQVARRWKTQINENSKAWAFQEVLPELNHNAVVGYEYPAEISRSALVVFLCSSRLHPRTLLRYQITSELLSRNKVAYEVIEGRGDGVLSQMMSLVLFGDWVSYYLALLYEIDPSPVKVIDYLKKRLAES